jgi:excisionase family DNA binding protein
LKYLNSKEACEYLGVNRYTLYEYIRQGKLKAHKLGGGNSRRHWRFTVDDLDEFVQGNDNEVGMRHVEPNNNTKVEGSPDRSSARLK